MYADLSTSIEINDDKQPEYNDYINNEYELREQARQLLKSKLINAGIEFARSANSRAFEEFYKYISINIPKTPEPSWTHKAIEDAEDLIKEYFIDEIVQQLIDGGEISSDMYNDYDNGDGIFHETITDRYYHKTDAMELLDELYEHEETDSGIWEGLDWEKVIQVKAAYTYGNAVMSEWNDIIEKINDIDPESLDVTWDIILAMIELHPTDEIINEDNEDEEELIDLSALSGDQYDEIEFVTEHFKTTYEDEWNTKLEAQLRALVLEKL
jgi:hypothetical protein